MLELLATLVVISLVFGLVILPFVKLYYVISEARSRAYRRRRTQEEAERQKRSSPTRFPVHDDGPDPKGEKRLDYPRILVDQ
jgi:regulatory protein YycH of two-component signal transduction system YycFG